MKTLGIRFESEIRIAIDFKDDKETKFGTLKTTGLPVDNFVPFEFVTDDGLKFESSDDGILEINDQYITVINEEKEGYMLLYGMKED